MARAIAPSWQQGVRREAGRLLSYIAGSGNDSRELVVAFSRVLKRVEPGKYKAVFGYLPIRTSNFGKQVRLLEAHIVCLFEDFYSWMQSEPEVLESSRPSEEEMTAYEEAEENHRAQVSLSTLFCQLFAPRVSTRFVPFIVWVT